MVVDWMTKWFEFFPLDSHISEVSLIEESLFLFFPRLGPSLTITFAICSTQVRLRTWEDILNHYLSSCIDDHPRNHLHIPNKNGQCHSESGSDTFHSSYMWWNILDYFWESTRNGLDGCLEREQLGLRRWGWWKQWEWAAWLWLEDGNWSQSLLFSFFLSSHTERCATDVQNQSATFKMLCSQPWFIFEH